MKPTVFILLGLLLLADCLLMGGCEDKSNTQDDNHPHYSNLRKWVTEETAYGEVEKGMSKQDVIKLMGKPDRTFKREAEEGGNYRYDEEWFYEYPSGPGTCNIYFDRKGIVVFKQFGFC